MSVVLCHLSLWLLVAAILGNQYTALQGQHEHQVRQRKLKHCELFRSMQVVAIITKSNLGRVTHLLWEAKFQTWP